MALLPDFKNAGDFARLLAFRQTRRLRDQDIEGIGFTQTAAGDFKPYYQANILPHVQAYELKRVQALRSLRFRALLALPAGLGCVLVALYITIYRMSHFDPQIVLFMTIAPATGLTWWSLTSIRNYQADVKDTIYPLIFGFFGKDFVYHRESPITVASLIPSGIIPSYDKEKPGDYVRGAYRGVPVEILEAKMTETQGSGKNRRTVTVFKGLFVNLESPKKFKGKTLIRKDHGFMNRMAYAFTTYERVRLEDPAFEKQFEVFADDQVEARYLLTTSFMERLLKLVDIFESKGLQASFYGNRLLLMIPTKRDYFKESPVFRPATFAEEIDVVLQEMRTLFEIIEILKFDEKTGL